MSSLQAYKFVLISVFLCLQGLALAQSSRWAYPGGDSQDDFATGLVRSPNHGYVACINGGATEDISFSVVKLDSIGNLVWFIEIDKDSGIEFPNQIIRDQIGSGYIITGSANISSNPWLIHIDEDGNIISTSEIWSDLTPGFSGIGARTASINDSNYVVATYQADNFDLYFTTIETDALGFTSTLSFPGDALSSSFAITDISDTPTETEFVIAGNSFDIAEQPFIYIINKDGDSLNYIPFAIDSVVVLAIDTTSDGGLVATGANYDSTRLFFTYFNTLTGIITEFDTLYPSTGLRIIGQDIIELSDGIFGILAVEIHPFGKRSSFIRIDASGNIIDENIILLDAGNIALTQLVKDNDVSLAASGSITTGVTEKLNEFLIIRSDSMKSPLCVYDCVWPGDADNNGFIEMNDLLFIGAGNNETGFTRTDSEPLEFIAHLSDEWLDDFPTGLNYKYTDCNGDGIINVVDTTALQLNYNLSHNIFSLRESGGGDYPLWLNTAGLIIHEGYNEIPVMLGTEDIPVDNIYGFEFSVSYSHPYIIDSTSVKIQFNDSWLGDAELHLLQLDNNFPLTYNIDAGVTRKDHNNSSGYGEVARMSFVVEDNIAGISLSDSVVIFSIEGASGITNTLEPVSLSASTYSIAIPVENLTKNEGIKIFPNPVSGNIIKIVGAENSLLNANWKLT
ncbi:MAG: hypothetical protein H7Y00_12315, partial [Fimbriimonadaceae bacterium]|nr:hypothetical protein [Chitinophagales bacterium]